MNWKNLYNKSTIGTGVFTLTVICIACLAIVYSQRKQAVETFSPNIINPKNLPVYCVDTSEPKIALSFDAAWGNEDTKKILKVLKEKDIKVTFFMTGGWIESYPDDVKAIAKAGHELGNHSENHKQMSTLSAEECKKEIMAPHEKVKKLTGVDMTVFRPPYGDYNDTLIGCVQECGYHAVQWDVDTVDTESNTLFIYQQSKSPI